MDTNIQTKPVVQVSRSLKPNFYLHCMEGYAHHGTELIPRQFVHSDSLALILSELCIEIIHVLYVGVLVAHSYTSIVTLY